MSENTTSPTPVSPVGGSIVPPVSPIVPVAQLAADLPPHKKLPLFVVLLIALLAAISVFAIYLLIQVRSLTLSKLPPLPSPTPLVSADPTADWQTFANKDLKVTLNYPNNWKLDTQAISDTGTPVYLVSENGSIIKMHSYSDTSKTIVEYLTKQDKISLTSWEGSPSMEVKSTNNTVIGEHSVIQREENMLAAGFTRLATYIKNNNSLIQVSLDPKNGGELNPVDIETYNQILSTIKFTETSEQVESICIYKGKTYKEGESLKIDKCNTCSCSSGEVMCTLMACQ